jgi:hypothetical protein
MISDASKLTRGFLLSGRMKKPWVSLCPLLLCKHDLGGQGRGLDQRSVTGATGELFLQLEVDGNEPREGSVLHPQIFSYNITLSLPLNFVAQIPAASVEMPQSLESCKRLKKHSKTEFDFDCCLIFFDQPKKVKD